MNSESLPEQIFTFLWSYDDLPYTIDIKIKATERMNNARLSLADYKIISENVCSALGDLIEGSDKLKDSLYWSAGDSNFLEF